MGTTAYVGLLERGPVGELITLTSKKDMVRRTGGLIPESELPLCALHFYDLGRGAGSLHLVRVTDGTEESAATVLFDRGDPARPAVRVVAANGGSWGGKAAVLVGAVASIPAIGRNTLTFPTSQKADRWRGGRLRLLGVPSRSYRVTGAPPR